MADKAIRTDSFSVAPQLLGLPLAGPWRRAAAMGVDLFLIAVLLRFGGMVFGLAAALLLLRISASRADQGVTRVWVRNALRFSAAAVIFITVVWGWGLFGRNDDSGNGEDPPEPAAELAGGGGNGGGDVNIEALNAVSLSVSESFKLAAAVTRLVGERDSAAAHERAHEIATAAKGIDEGDRNELRLGLLKAVDENQNRVAHRAIVAAFGPPPENPPTPSADSLALALAAAIGAKDEELAGALRAELEQQLAGPEVDRLEKNVERLSSRNDSLRTALSAQREGRSVRAIFKSILDDLGLGFGWSAVYFTAFLALWKGQTPGKRLLKARVIRLDGKPLGWWVSFERFGGYAASITLGLLGFAQILWDRNRQGIHDKIVETVVTRVS